MNLASRLRRLKVRSETCMEMLFIAEAHSCFFAILVRFFPIAPQSRLNKLRVLAKLFRSVNKHRTD